MQEWITRIDRSITYAQPYFKDELVGCTRDEVIAIEQHLFFIL